MSPNRLAGAASDVFILGAGFSKAISEHMPTLRELSRAVPTRISQLVGIDDIPFISDDIEMAMTFLSQPQPWMSEAERLRNRALFLDITEAITAEISDRAASVRASSCPPWLLRFVHWLYYRKPIVITLNYDTLLEAAISEIPGGDCDPKKLIPFRFAADEGVLSGGDVLVDSLELLKLHGSVNWRYSGRLSYAGELIQWSPAGKWLIRADSVPSREKVSDTFPLIIPPAADKAGYFEHHSIRYLWRRASQALATAKRVFCIGYSLPATDLTIRFLLSDLDRTDVLDFYVVNLPSTAEHFSEVLPESCFRIDQRFVGSDPLPPFVDALFTDEFFPDDVHLHKQAAGPVETAIRARVSPGVRMRSRLDAGEFMVDRLTPSSVTLLIDQAGIPIRLPWESLELVALELQEAWRQLLDIDGLDRALRKYCDRNLGAWIAALFEAAGLATVWYDVNRWVISPTDANGEEIARSKRSTHA